jgi:hypothetical protein
MVVVHLREGGYRIKKWQDIQDQFVDYVAVAVRSWHLKGVGALLPNVQWIGKANQWGGGAVGVVESLTVPCNFGRSKKLAIPTGF